MPAIPHVVRRGAIYYWRRRLPAALAESRNSATLILGLRTSNPRRARFLAGQISALADLSFFPAAMTYRLSQQQIQQVFRDVFTRHLDKLEAVAARERIESNFDAERSRRSDLVMGWVYRLFETRGSSATVDERAAAQMTADGMAAEEIAETSAMLDLMQRQNLASDSQARLAAIVKGVGGEPNPMNVALAQEAIYRAMAEANFQTERRYNGARVEIEKTIAVTLEQHTGADNRAATRDSQPSHAASFSSSSIVVDLHAAKKEEGAGATLHADAPAATSDHAADAMPEPSKTVNVKQH